MKRTPRTSRDLQAAERREQILQGAKDMFAEHGFHGTSMRMINKHVGITDGLLYHYFPGGKQEILETIFNEAQEARLASMDKLLASIEPNLPLETAMTQFLVGMFRTLTGDRAFLRIMFRDAESIQSEQRNFFSEMIQQRHGTLTEVLKKRAEAGEIREMDYALAAHQILSVGVVCTLREVSFINVIGVEAETYIRSMVTFSVSQWRK
ncbi:TetR/AcrR family transcriptional regulator [Paenibacillus rhizovicinus]|uniref:TetR/AcrR family transcriptional regulator n=1 Tax=Paenibacillus rhizovicinus TaxID=2704463 RepID=A0A6C0P6D4_9BACL|nr:TetR/AcrR family transcriptional regulator [Paenibacillus rhizovicinus]QHW34078.1 TetR/AcrR family transcriptional regulator [Paenibacillus rhizovicinus]